MYVWGKQIYNQAQLWTCISEEDKCRIKPRCSYVCLKDTNLQLSFDVVMYIWERQIQNQAQDRMCTSEGDKFRTKPMCGYVDVCLDKANLQQDPIMTMYL